MATVFLASVIGGVVGAAVVLGALALAAFAAFRIGRSFVHRDLNGWTRGS
jgi:hypothetical protein